MQENLYKWTKLNVLYNLPYFCNIWIHQFYITAWKGLRNLKKIFNILIINFCKKAIQFKRRSRNITLTVTTCESRVYFEHTYFLQFLFCNLTGCDTIILCILYIFSLPSWLDRPGNMSDASSSGPKFINSLGCIAIRQLMEDYIPTNDRRCLVCMRMGIVRFN